MVRPVCRNSPKPFSPPGGGSPVIFYTGSSCGFTENPAVYAADDAIHLAAGYFSRNSSVGGFSFTTEIPTPGNAAFGISADYTAQSGTIPYGSYDFRAGMGLRTPPRRLEGKLLETFNDALAKEPVTKKRLDNYSDIRTESAGITAGFGITAAGKSIYNGRTMRYQGVSFSAGVYVSPLPSLIIGFCGKDLFFGKAGAAPPRSVSVGINLRPSVKKINWDIGLNASVDQYASVSASAGTGISVPLGKYRFDGMKLVTINPVQRIGCNVLYYADINSSAGASEFLNFGCGIFCDLGSIFRGLRIEGSVRYRQHDGTEFAAGVNWRGNQR